MDHLILLFKFTGSVICEMLSVFFLNVRRMLTSLFCCGANNGNTEENLPLSVEETAFTGPISFL